MASRRSRTKEYSRRWIWWGVAAVAAIWLIWGIFFVSLGKPESGSSDQSTAASSEIVAPNGG